MEDAIDVVAAWTRIEAETVPLGVEEVEIEAAAGRVLQRAVVVDRDLPPFDRAAMDGFAVRAADVARAAVGAPVRLRVAGEATPGRPWAGDLPEAACVRIMTGAPVPAGCDAVVAVEATSGFATLASVEVQAPARPGDNLTARAAERRAGDAVFAPGHRLRAVDVGALAAVGVGRVGVGRRPRVAVLSTGDELVPHTRTPGPAAIRDANGPMLAALAGPWAEQVIGLGIAPDDAETLGAAVRTGLRAADLLLVSGGVSMGVYDLVAAALAAAGVRFHFRRVALQPGKPTGFGTHAGGVVLALPGNPVSSLVTFRLFAALALARQEGETAARPRWTQAPAGFAWTRRNPRWLVLPGRWREGAVDRVPYTGSGDLLAYAAADCQIVLPPEVAAVAPGDPVAVWPL